MVLWSTGAENGGHPLPDTAWQGAPTSRLRYESLPKIPFNSSRSFRITSQIGGRVLRMAPPLAAPPDEFPGLECRMIRLAV